MLRQYAIILVVLSYIIILGNPIGIAQLHVTQNLPEPSLKWHVALSSFGNKVQSGILGDSLMVEPTSSTSFIMNPALSGFSYSTRTTAQYGQHNDGTKLTSVSLSGAHCFVAAAGFMLHR